MDNTADRIIEKIKNAGKVFIAGHINPDGDCVGACAALFHIVKKLNSVPVALLEPFHNKFDFAGLEIYNGEIPEKVNLILTVDTADESRLPNFAREALHRAEFSVSLDHHITNTRFADLNIVENKSSACEVVYNFFKDSLEFDSDIASALCTGIVTDTGCFRYEGVCAETYSAVAELVRRGADCPKIITETMFRHTFAEANVLALAISRINFDPATGIAYSYMTREDFAALNANKSDIDGIPEYILSIHGVEISAFFYERDENIVKGSFRSVEFNVAGFCLKFGGGGHKNAAGANFSGNIFEVIKHTVNLLKEELS